ncbi:MAG TPA: glycosyltransferase family 2 protein [Vicinamibacterales bacterium]|nr:glycosyltransferase family 2 protein [Vicinamibacterales bacterium]
MSSHHPREGGFRVGAVVGVLDECELIEPCVAHLRAAGVARIVISDYGSTDGTLERVAALQGPDLTVVHTRSDEWRTFAEWGQREAALIRDIDADWVMFIDADEFPIARTGSIADCVTSGLDVLFLRRFNVPLTDAGPQWPNAFDQSTLDKLLLCTLTVPDFRAYVEENQGAPFAQVAPDVKVMVRPEMVVSLAGGHHDAELSAPGRRGASNELVIAHVPFTTPARFARKVQNIRAEMQQHPSTFQDGMCWHWSRWVSLDDAGRLDEEFDRQVLHEESLARARRTGAVQSAAEWFELAARHN